MGLIVINFVVTAVIVWWCWKLAKTREGMLWITGGSLGFGLVSGLFCMSMALALQGFATFVVALMALPFAPNQRLFKLAIVAVPIPIYGWLISLSQPELRDRAELRHEFPLISLADRLEYEAKAAAANASPDRIELPLEIEKQLSDDERNGGSDIRTHILGNVHDRTMDEFARARGFGPIRMMTTRRERVELPDVAPIPYEQPPPARQPGFQPNGSAVEQTDEPKPNVLPLSREKLATIYRDSFEDFLEPARMGYFRDRTRVAGFAPHRFYRMPGTEGLRWQPRYSRDQSSSQTGPAARSEWRKNWAITRLELIGILSHEKPVAYVSEHLPQLEELGKYPTRDLTDFEQSALVRLREQEDLVIDTQSTRILMLGSLRANDKCRRCHTVQRGELLGALSYEMLPE